MITVSLARLRINDWRAAPGETSTLSVTTCAAAASAPAAPALAAAVGNGFD